MYNNQYQMDEYTQVQPEQMHNPSQIGYYPLQERNALQSRNHPMTNASAAFNQSAPNTTEHQGQAYQPGNYPIISPPPSYSPPAPTNLVNNETTVVTQAPAIVSTIFLHCLNTLNGSLCPGIRYYLVPLKDFIYKILNRL